MDDEYRQLERDAYPKCDAECPLCGNRMYAEEEGQICAQCQEEHKEDPEK